MNMDEFQLKAMALDFAIKAGAQGVDVIELAKKFIEFVKGETNE